LSRKRKRKAPRPRSAAPARPTATKEAAPAVAKAALAKPRRSADQRPPAPWGKAPLAELTILAGIISLAYGLLAGAELWIGLGVALAGVGGMEVSIREHFAGYRSHTTLLAGAVFVFVVGGLFYGAHQVLAVALPIGAVAFAIVFYLARRAFQRASGGLSYRIGGMRG
jgi:hypothetical protein